MRHENNFNFLRFWLAWVVILSHSFELIDGNRSRELLTQAFHTYSFGEFAVNAFFLMSGFFIAQSWVFSPHFGDFIKKRLLRLLPGFFCAVLISVFIVGPLGSPHYWQNFPHWRFWPGLLVLRFDSPYSFDGWPYPMINGPLWTLHYEYVCYWLVAALGVMQLITRRTLMIGLFVAVLAAYLFMMYKGLNHYQPETQYGFWAWTYGGRYIRLFAFFMAGVVWFNEREGFTLNGYWALAIAALCVVLFGNHYGAAIAMTLPLAYLLHYLGNRPMPALRLFQPVDLSYGMYLYAWPIQKLLLYYGVTRNAWMLTAITSVLCIAAAFASWYAVEKPFLKLKPKPRAAA